MKIMNIFITPESLLIPLGNTLSSSNQWPDFCHYILKFLEFYITGIIQYVFFYAWFLSLSIIILRFNICSYTSPFFFFLLSNISLQIQWKQWQILFSWAPKSLWMVTAAMKLKDACSLEEKLLINLDSILKSRDITLPTKVHIVKTMVFQQPCMDVRAGP